MSGPSDAFTVFMKKKSDSCEPRLAERSQVNPLSSSLRNPATSELSLTMPPNCGVKPPGAISWNEKQLGSAKTWARASWSGTLSVTVTTGQFAEPMPWARRTSPMSSVWPPSRL